MTTPTTRSTCAQCGGEILPGDRFCGSCGTPVEAGAPTPAPSWVGGTASGTVAASVHPPTDRSPWSAVATRLQAATLGEFEILTEIGRGGMAAVYLARDLSLNRPVAIKVMSPGLLLGAVMVDRFRQEAVTVANLQHAHIVSIHAVRQIEDLHFFVMQFVPGRTIEGVLKEHGALPVPVTLAWLFQVGSALGYAHRRGVIHRDVKPGNILLNIDGEAVVTDFGIAKVAENPSLTQTGAVVGTPLYMSPEQCYAKELTGASDQYSLGVVIYEMLAGHPPFSGSSFALMRAHTDDPPPSLRAIRPDVPESVEAALMRMLAKRPDERFPTMVQAIAGFGAAPLAPADPIHATLQELAAATERLEGLRDVLRTPASPIPRTRERLNRQPPDTPRTVVPPTEELIVSIAPPPIDLEPGGTATLHATVKTSSGKLVPQREIAWESSDPGVVSVDATTGLLTAHGPGRSDVTASAGVVRDTAEVVVDEPTATHVEIAMPADRLQVGASITIAATVTNRHGFIVRQHVEWSLDTLGVVALVRERSKPEPSTTVTVRCVGAGVTGLYAACGGVVSRVSLDVAPEPVVAPAPVVAPPLSAATPPPAEAAPPRPAESARVPTANAPVHAAPPPEQKPPRSVEPTKPPIAPPPNATAVLSALTSAPASVERDRDLGKALTESPPRAVKQPAPVAPREAASLTTAPVSATAAPAVPASPASADARVAATPAGGRWRWVAAAAVPLLVVAGYLLTRPGATRPAAQTDTAVSRDSGRGRSTPPVVPQVDPRTIAKGPDSSSGVRQPVDPPPPPVTSTTQTPPTPVARRIQLSAPTGDAILPGQTMQIAATVRDASGATMKGASVRWTSNNPGVATVDPTTGAVKAVAQGTARISARSGTVSQELTVSVAAPPADPAVVTSVELGEIASMIVGESVRLAATTRNAYGNSAPGATIQWTSSNPDVASVAPNGQLTARGPGSATIQASSGERSVDRRVTVRAREVAVTPKVDSPAAPPPKSEAELRAEVRSVVASYTRGIEMKDTSAMRSVFPSVPAGQLSNWQTNIFADARDAIQMRGAIEILDTPRDAVGNQVRARGQYTASFYSKANRREMQLNVPFTAVVQRMATGWRIVNIR